MAAASTISNAWCVVHGTPGATPLTIEGPFESKAAAEANAAEDKQTHPDVPVTVDVLVNPANC